MIGRRTFVGGVAAMTATRVTAEASGIARLVDDFVRERGFNGVVAHARRGNRDYLGAFGTADVATGKPITAATRFAFGSASKWLTAVAVLRLVDQHRLDLDRPITAYLPHFRPDTGAQVTLRRLLSNTSGIPDALTAAAQADPALRASKDGSAVMVARYGGGDLAFAPGHGWDYSMLNWVIVHAVLERIARRPFAALLDAQIFQPLHMRHAGLVDTTGGRGSDVASAYASLSPLRPKMAGVPPFAGASGNVFASADDAIAAAHGVFAGSLLSSRSRAALTRVEWEPETYALGGRVRTLSGGRWAWLSGKIDGYRALIAHDLVRDRTIVIFNNIDMAQAPIATLAERLIASG